MGHLQIVTLLLLPGQQWDRKIYGCYFREILHSYSSFGLLVSLGVGWSLALMLFLYKTHRNPPLSYPHPIQRDFILRQIPFLPCIFKTFYLFLQYFFFNPFNPYSTDCIFVSSDFISQTDATDPYCLLSLLL